MPCTVIYVVSFPPIKQPCSYNSLQQTDVNLQRVFYKPCYMTSIKTSVACSLYNTEMFYNHQIEYCGRLIRTHASYSGDIRFKSRLEIVTEVFRTFHYSHPTNSKKLP
jgi:hypothetical protein